MIRFMLRFIMALLLLTIAVWIGLQIQADPGYLLLSYSHWTIEMPLWLSLVIIILAYLITHWVFKVLHFGGSVSGKVRLWSGRRRLRNAQHRTNRGLIDLAEGNWRRAEKNLVKGAKNSNTPLINYLVAARAAQEQGAYERRDNYLRRAHKVNPNAKIAIELTQAQLQIYHQQLEQALATLRHLRELAPQHRYVLKLLKSLYIKLNDWQSLADLLPELRKAKIVNQEKLTKIEHQVYKELLLKSAQKADDSSKKVWATVPKTLKLDPEIVSIYSEYLIATQQNEIAEKLIRESLKKHWDSNLIKLYSIIPDIDRKKQLLIAENWLKTHKKDPTLLASLGRLSKANQLWGKARSYFEASIQIKPNTEAYAELGQLYEHLNEIPLALDCYRKAISVG